MGGFGFAAGLVHRGGAVSTLEASGARRRPLAASTPDEARPTDRTEPNEPNDMSPSPTTTALCIPCLLCILLLFVSPSPCAGVSLRARSARFKQPSNLFRLRMNASPRVATPNFFAAAQTNGAGRSTTVREVTP